ncbi:hypothetical protein GCM10007231_16770 [Nocardioides daphniae]|uniref:NlpC/P60 domain-containing protein n=1 Tax=Nocardioides daphniae TaxID=402297 RepID=A0ABQ1Q8W3_9ACTN|nr:hypothetical protein GCM10007231_16770 [Nocardioides daphniae]
MTHGRNRRAKALALLSVLAVTGVVSAVPAQAEPDVEDVREKVDRLYHQAEQAQERYNDSALRLKGLNAELSSLKADEKRQGRRLDEVRDQVQELIVRQYKGEGVNTVGQVVVSDDPSSFLGQLTTMQAFSDLQADLLDDFSDEAKALDLRQSTARERRADIKDTTADLKAEKAAVEAKLAQAKELLSRLEAEEREELSASRDSGRLPTNVPASGRAAAAVKAALAQVGDAYVYGAVGPDAYDCSGLTMMAWGAAGVGLPHSSSAQFSSGARVAQNDLKPGDLVFYYSPISHVGMYIGNGQIVHAANPSSGVRIAGVFSMPYVGAVRPG